jgi:hypothetical protein
VVKVSELSNPSYLDSEFRTILSIEGDEGDEKTRAKIIFDWSVGGGC